MTNGYGSGRLPCSADEIVPQMRNRHDQNFD